MAGRAHGLQGCAAKGCSTRVDSSKLMCPSHWRMVPRPTQDRVLTAWRAYKAAVESEASGGDALPAVKELRAAQAEAVSAVATAEGRVSR